ncbi:MAG: hypothetical protein QME81_16860 [bacterium]|nr:hypothetical protein [bacterium]
MLKAVRAIYDNGEVELLEKKPKGRYGAVVIFLETLPDDELEDMILAKELGLEKDYEDAITLLKKGKMAGSNQVKQRLEEKVIG